MMRRRQGFMDSFKGYCEWDQDTKELAIKKLINTYLESYPGIVIPVSFYLVTLEEIEKDLQYYEEIEEYEICQILKDAKEKHL